MDNIYKAPMAPTSFCSGYKERKADKSAPSVANVCWDTFTCTLGWPVQGIWPPGSDGTDINAVDLLPKYDVRNGRNNIYSGVLATADDFGKVKLFNSPCTGKKPQGLNIAGIHRMSQNKVCRER